MLLWKKCKKKEVIFAKKKICALANDNEQNATESTCTQCKR